jgi:hypothetical protein
VSVLTRPQDVLRYAATSRAIWDSNITPPVAGSLAEHRAADVAAAAAPARRP